MANKLPYDDEDAINQGITSPEEIMVAPPEEMQQDDIVDPNNKALDYFKNDQSQVNPAEENTSMDGKMVGQYMSRSPAVEDTPTLNESETIPEFSPREQLLQKYGDLKKLQAEVKDKNTNLNYGAAGNQIAQAIASGYGAKIGDGNDLIKTMQSQNEGKIKDYNDMIKDRMNIPDSDVAKFYRYKLAKSMKEADPKADISMLDGMSATEMEQFNKLQSKNNGRGDLFFTQLTNPATGKAEVVAVDRKTGNIVKSVGDRTFQDKVVKDPVTGQNMIYNQAAGTPQTMLSPSQKGMAKLIDSNNSPGNVPNEESKKMVQEQNSSPTVLNKVNPELYKKFNDQQKELLATVKDNRDVATSATTLASKLKPGLNGDIDSGLLGGIQTQAAKMAGQKGVLTDQDLVKFAGAGGVKAKLDRIASGGLMGELSDADVKFFKMFAHKMQEANASDIKNKSQIMVKNVHNEAKDYLPGLTEDNVAKWLNVDSLAPASQGTASGDTNALKVKIQQGEQALLKESNPNIKAKIEEKLKTLKSQLGQ